MAQSRVDLFKINKNGEIDWKALDNPTFYNALEVVDPNRLSRSFNVRPFVYANPSLPSVLDYALTEMFCSLIIQSLSWMQTVIKSMWSTYYGLRSSVIIIFNQIKL